MNTNRLLSLIFTTGIVIKIYLENNFVEALTASTGLLVILSMIWHGDLWAKFVMPMGFLESKATDFKKSDEQGPIVCVFGWILLTLLLFTAYW